MRDLRQLLEKVKHGDTDAMLEISEWYKENGQKEKAINWGAHCLVEPESALTTFEDAVSLLEIDIGYVMRNKRKSDIKKMQDGIYEYLVNPYEDLTARQLADYVDEKNAQVTPKIKGLDVFVIYAKSEMGYVLYKAITATSEKIDVTNGILTMLPDIVGRDGIYIHNDVIENTFKKQADRKKYEYEINGVPYIVLHATVFIKKSAKDRARIKYKIKNYEDVAILLSKPVLASSKLNELKEKASKIKDTVADIRKKQKNNNLKLPMQEERYAELKKRYDRLKVKAGDKPINEYLDIVDVAVNDIAVSDNDIEIHSFLYRAEKDSWIITNIGCHQRAHLNLGEATRKFKLKKEIVSDYKKLYSETYRERELVGFRISDFTYGKLLGTIKFK